MQGLHLPEDRASYCSLSERVQHLIKKWHGFFPFCPNLFCIYGYPLMTWPKSEEGRKQREREGKEKNSK